VNHSRILYEVGTKAFYRTPEKVASLERCKNANVYFNEHQSSLNEICKYILQLENDLRRILPAQGNNSFISSNDKLTNLIVFSKKETQGLLSIKSLQDA
jgi:3-methyladenine DNA glycosylase/8-oxoguanine DNA glycosylase